MNCRNTLQYKVLSINENTCHTVAGDNRTMPRRSISTRKIGTAAVLPLLAVFVSGCIKFVEQTSSTESPARSVTDAAVERTTLPGRNGSSVSGTARFADTQAPVAGIQVIVYSEHSDRQLAAITKSDGAYSIFGIDPDTDLMVLAKPEQVGWRAKVSTPGFRLREGEHRSGVDVVVTTGHAPPVAASVSGTVWDATNVNKRMVQLAPELFFRQRSDQDDQQALLNAWLKKANEARTPFAGIEITLESRGATHRTISDSHGRFTFTDLSDGNYLLRATPPPDAVVERLSWSVYDRDLAPGELRLSVKEGEKKEGIEFQFRRDAALISGELRNTAGHAIEGATITATVREESSEVGPQIRPLTVRTTSDERGRYTLGGLIPISGVIHGSVTYDVQVEANGFVPKKSGICPLDAEIVAGLAVIFETAQSDLREKPTILFPAETLARLHGNNLTGVDFAMLRGATIGGVLRDVQGNAMPACALNLRELEPRPSSEQPNDIGPPDVTTDEYGAFNFEKVPSGTYEIHANVNGAVVRATTEAVVVQEGASISGLQLTADIDSPGSIEGTVVDASTGVAIKDFSVEMLSLQNTNELRPRTGRLSREPNAAGTFYIDDISSGIISGRVTAPGYAPATVTTALKSRETNTVRVALQREGILVVHLTRAGDPIAGEFVNASDLFDTTNAIGLDAVEGQTGCYKASGLRSGQYRLSARTQIGGEYYSEIVDAVSVTSGSTTETTLEFDGDAGVSGRLFGEDRRGEGIVLVLDAAEAVDDIYPYDTSIRAFVSQLARPRDFAFTRLQPGEYVIVGRLGFQSDATGWEERRVPVTLRDSQVISIDFGP